MYHRQITKPSRVIKTNGSEKNGFVQIVKNHFRGMTTIRVDILEEEFEDCSKEYFESNKDNEKHIKETYGK